ncbi:hypothetical protein MSG28_000689 [Choristoneura fumiferana]|uniref:Uncharacterized protein n=1 Tax=Choristoneura fumiferana TaxID=7141 RepID=A0ACC0K1Q6_CHOFU|nr:hypothetical protein MSG28_000689 [Choristoneura fumiferana]
MTHGPCGTINPNSPCMKNGRCTKRFPKGLVTETVTGENGYPSYRRRSAESGGLFTAEVRTRVLSRAFETHLNVKLCASIASLKYVCKYINKGGSRATLALQIKYRDEVSAYQSDHYIFTSEAVSCTLFVDQPPSQPSERSMVFRGLRRRLVYELHPTFNVACSALHLLDDDKSWDQTLAEAVSNSTYSTELSEQQSGEIFFLDAPGVTGKTFLTGILLAEARKQGKNALAVAFSGITATLLPGGKTAHTTFKIPIDLDSTETPVCKVRNCDKTRVLQECSLIVRDECTMAHKKTVEAVDRMLQDVRKTARAMDFAGRHGTRADEVNACLKRSVLWPTVQKLRLTENMRVQQGGGSQVQEFARVLLQVGEGLLEETIGLLRIPETLCRIVLPLKTSSETYTET